MKNRNLAKISKFKMVGNFKALKLLWWGNNLCALTLQNRFVKDLFVPVRIFEVAF